MYRTLDPSKIIDTAYAIAQRIGERFPQSGLSGVASDLTALSKDAVSISHKIDKPNLPLRVGVTVMTLGFAALIAIVARLIRVDTAVNNMSDLAQGVDSFINDLFFAGVAVWFLVSIETRLKRRKALDLIAELRSMAHVIDMHQLTKDPDRVGKDYSTTDSSPKVALTPALLTRYLDYCSEMLSILSKLAALMVVKFDDPVALSAVNDLEDLASGLQRKMWQKIMIIDRIASTPSTAPSASARP